MWTRVATRVLASDMHAPQLGLLFRRELRVLAAELALGAGDGHAVAGSAKVARMLKNIFPIGSAGS